MGVVRGVRGVRGSGDDDSPWQQFRPSHPRYSETQQKKHANMQPSPLVRYPIDRYVSAGIARSCWLNQ